jgi:hypothetical protein
MGTEAEHTPESGVLRGSAKARYRRQMKLQAAMTRVAELLLCLWRDQEELNANNLMLAACLSDALASPVKRFASTIEEGDLQGPLLTFLVKGVKRRRKATAKRTTRRKEQDLQARLNELRRQGFPV